MPRMVDALLDRLIEPDPEEPELRRREHVIPCMGRQLEFKTLTERGGGRREGSERRSESPTFPLVLHESMVKMRLTRKARLFST